MGGESKASELGAKVAIVEEGTIGGACVNIGCVPSKTLINTLNSTEDDPMVKKGLVYGAGGLVLAIAVLIVANVLGERVGVAEIVVQKDVVLDEATLQQALAHSADCAGFKITEVRPAGEGKVLARITGMHGACCLSPAKSALAKVPGVKQVEVALLPKSGA